VNAERDPSDPALDRLLRADAGASPPTELDAAILAAAHRAVASAPRETRGAEATRPWRWWMPLAAAATIGAVAIGVLQLTPSGRESAPTVVSDMPATTNPQVAAPVPSPTPPPPVQMQPSAPKVTTDTPAPRASAPVRRKASEPAAAPEPFPADRARSAQEPAQAPASPPPAPAAAARSAPADPMNAESARRDAGQSAAGALDRAVAPALAKSAIKDESEARRADEFVARIRRLRFEGKMEEAARELAAFRAAFVDADARLPADLRSWAASVKQ
jgi:outer membrane biosynthesis protein TonB